MTATIEHPQGERQLRAQAGEALARRHSAKLTYMQHGRKCTVPPLPGAHRQGRRVGAVGVHVDGGGGPLVAQEVHAARDVRAPVLQHGIRFQGRGIRGY